MASSIAPGEGLLATPAATSLDRPWDGVTVNWYDWTGPGDASSGVLEEDVVGVRTSGIARLTQRRDGRVHTATVGPGNIGIHPKGMPSRWAWDAPGSIVLMRVPPRLLQEAAETALRAPRSRTELANCFGTRDLFIEQMVAQFMSELRRPTHPAQAFIAQALSGALALHLVHRFNCQPTRRERVPRGLSARSLQRVQEFISAHLHEQIDLQMLANVAAVSRFHFARCFKESTGISAIAYLEQARMHRAQELIRLGRLALAQVAALVGYADQSYFTRRFRLVVGVTPAAYARFWSARR